MPKKLTHDEYLARINDTHLNDVYELVTPYISMSDNVTLKHKKCGRVFTLLAKTFVGSASKKPTNCPDCATQPSRRLSQKEMEEKFNKHDKEYKLVGEYLNTHTLVEILHLRCNNIFKMRPNNFFIKNNRCPKCTISKGEDMIRKWLDENLPEVSYIPQWKPKKLISNNRISFDFFIESYNLLIEYDGRFHYEPFSNKKEHVDKFKSNVKNDNLKNDFAILNKIILLRIPFYHQSQISCILSILFNDYLLSESTVQTLGTGNIDIQLLLDKI